MNAFVQRHTDLGLSVLSGFDRLVFRGHLRALSYPHGMDCYLSANRILLKDFAQHAEQTTDCLKAASLAHAESLGREIRYLGSSNLRKEDIARQIAQRDHIQDGLICVLTCVEPCLSFEVHKNNQSKRLEIQSQLRKCLHLYHYYQHPVFGFMHARIQTWFPFAIQICLNGREWLARQMDQAGLGYVRRDNCFTALEDAVAAQLLFDTQLRVHWPTLLGDIQRQIHPSHPEILGRLPRSYYWSVHQSEWASDLMFRCREDLETIYPRLVRQAITQYDSADVMRFLGKKIQEVPVRFQGEVSSDCSGRIEGVRVKHQVNGNSVKMYDKGSVLRIETTINEPRGFKVFRTSEANPLGEMDWRILRRGIADLERRATVSQGCNDRYAEKLSSVQATTTVQEVSEPLCQRVLAPGGGKPRYLRGLNPLSSADGKLLEVVARGAFVINGLRNKDLVGLLYPDEATDDKQKRQRSSRVTRQIRLLRGHGLLHKVPRSHRYQVSPKGRTALTTLLAARAADAETLTAQAV